jgi:hypothetical protein
VVSLITGIDGLAERCRDSAGDAYTVRRQRRNRNIVAASCREPESEPPVKLPQRIAYEVFHARITAPPHSRRKDIELASATEGVSVAVLVALRNDGCSGPACVGSAQLNVVVLIVAAPIASLNAVMAASVLTPAAPLAT